MEIYGRITSLHRSDKHVLSTHQSDFYEYSPESISVRSTRESERNSYIEKNTLLNIPKDLIK